ncbi:MAG: DUF1643 domain-containing protein [Methylotenera sp.]|nr:DUF1643 domain-containing protein [Methylotenera sp.]
MIIKQHKTLFQASVAHFSDCEKFRYWLRRDWDLALPAISFLMLNPSTADEMQNDPTIERCQRRAIAMGYGSMIIVNLFPFRMTDSRLLNTVNDLLGDLPEADNCILRAVEISEQTVCGWGKHPLAAPRAKAILQKLIAANLQHKVMCLQLNADNSPQHPLYIAYSKQPIPFIVQQLLN